MHGSGITWDYFLAEKLHKFVEEIEQMSQSEYDTWQNYYTVKGVLRDLQQKTDAHRNG